MNPTKIRRLKTRRLSRNRPKAKTHVPKRGKGSYNRLKNTHRM